MKKYRVWKYFKQLCQIGGNRGEYWNYRLKCTFVYLMVPKRSVDKINQNLLCTFKVISFKIK